MNCDEALLAISAALDGELSPAERVKLSEHLLSCASCRELAEDLRVLTEELGRSDREVPPSLAESVRRAVAEEPQASPDPKKRRRPPYLRAVAAMLALCVCLGGIGLVTSRYGGDSAAPAGGAAPALYQASPEGAGYAEEAAPESAEDADNGSAFSTYSAPTAGDADAADKAEAPMEAQSMPMPSSAPAAAAVEGGSGEMRAGGPSSDSYEETALTPEEAMELVFEYLGGYEAYPAAEQLPGDGLGPSYSLKSLETDQVSSEYCLDCTGQPDGGGYYEFHLYEIVTDKADGTGHTATLNWYTVSPEGEVTAQFPE